LGIGELPASGTDVAARLTAATSAAEPVGQVVLSAPLADGKRFLVLLESRMASLSGADDAAADGWRIGEIDITPLPLPYGLPAPAAPVPRATAPSADGA
jgi:hypothetical protein